MRVEIRTYVDINIGDVVICNDEKNRDYIGYVTYVGSERSDILWSDGSILQLPNAIVYHYLTGENKYDILK